MLKSRKMNTHIDQRVVYLTEIRLESSGAAHTTTASRGCSLVCAEVGASLRASSAVDKLVAGKTLVHVSSAFENTRVHVSCALGSDDGHGASIHVDFPGNIDHTVWRVECTFTPSVVDLTVLEGCAAVYWSPGSRPADGE